MGAFNVGYSETMMVLQNGSIKLLEPLAYMTNDGEIVVIPKKFSCDGATIPRFAQSFLGSPLSRHNVRAALLHDYSYRYHVFDREKCDELFHEALVSEGKGKFSAWLMYKAVRWFGEAYYNFEK